ncbi:MAG: 50S ribosomal protein L11 methyltransferase [Kiloniellaceae bacterium]
MAERRAPAWCVSIEAPVTALAALEAGLATLGGAVATDLPDAQGRARVHAYLPEEPDKARITALLAAAALAAGVEAPGFALERLPDLDWVAESRKSLPPVRAGPFYVYGAHVAAAPPAGSIPLQVEAGLGFGTGRHESTKGCLLALAELAGARTVRRALDMGCGSGILALAVAKLWACPVVAVDNDVEAVRVAAQNARLNAVADLVRVCEGDGYRCPAVARGAPYDMIVSNILAEPLCAMAPDLIARLAPGGVAVLSGLLAEQEGRVLACHEGLRSIRRIARGEWVTLIVESRTPTALSSSRRSN